MVGEILSELGGLPRMQFNGPKVSVHPLTWVRELKFSLLSIGGRGGEVTVVLVAYRERDRVVQH